MSESFTEGGGDLRRPRIPGRCGEIPQLLHVEGKLSLIPAGEISHLLAEGMCGRSAGPSRGILRHGKNDLRLLSVHLPRPAEVSLTVQRDLDVRTGDSVPDGCQRLVGLGGLAVRSDGNGVFHHTCL